MSGVRVQASVHAEVYACMLGFWVTGWLGLLGSSCAMAVEHVHGGGRAQAIWIPGLLGCFLLGSWVVLVFWIPELLRLLWPLCVRKRS